MKAKSGKRKAESPAVTLCGGPAKHGKTHFKFDPFLQGEIERVCRPTIRLTIAGQILAARLNANPSKDLDRAAVAAALMVADTLINYTPDYPANEGGDHAQ